MRGISTSAVYVLVLAGWAFAFEQPAGVPESDPGALDRVRERLIDSALRRTQGNKDATQASEELVPIGSTWWIAPRQQPGGFLQASIGDVKWFKVTGEKDAGFYQLELANGKPSTIRKEWLHSAIQDKRLISYDPAEKAREEEIREAAKAAHEAARARDELARAKAAAAKANTARVASIRNKKWPLPIEQAVIERKVQIGMTAEQVTMAWGKPAANNRSVGRWGTHEQWIYGDTYLYFENGVLTSYQERR
jgi:hypothetical protein